MPPMPEVGVTIYVIVAAAKVILVKLPLMFGALVPATAPLMPGGSTGADQLYVVPAGMMVPALGTPF